MTCTSTSTSAGGRLLWLVDRDRDRDGLAGLAVRMSRAAVVRQLNDPAAKPPEQWTPTPAPRPAKREPVPSWRELEHLDARPARALKPMTREQTEAAGALARGT